MTITIGAYDMTIGTHDMAIGTPDLRWSGHGYIIVINFFWGDLGTRYSYLTYMIIRLYQN